eukprot:bmy_07933T0
MEGVVRGLLLLLAGLPVLEANDLVDKDSPFYYGGKCKCKQDHKHSWESIVGPRAAHAAGAGRTQERRRAEPKGRRSLDAPQRHPPKGGFRPRLFVLGGGMHVPLLFGHKRMLV